MLRVLNIEEIEGLLILVPELAREQETSSDTFPKSVASWLTRLETVLAANRLYQAGTVAALRSAAAAATIGSIPEGMQVRGTPTRRKLDVMVASHVLQRACKIASDVLTDNRPRLADAEKVAHQIVAAARSRNLLVPKVSGFDNTQYLRQLVRGFVAQPDLENAMSHLESLVGPSDKLVFLDRALGHYRVDSVSAPSATTKF